jgi:hypothetical protein
MKNPKKLTRSQKEKLTKKHMEPSEYVLISEDAYTFTVQKRSKIGTSEEMMTLNK